MNKIPNQIKYVIWAISALIFILFFSGRINPFGLNNSVHQITGYFFGLAFANLDYFIISSIPVFGMLLNSKRKEFKITDLIKDILIVLLFVTFSLLLGLYILTYIGKPSPLVAQYFISEPFLLYSTLIILIGIGMPFIIKKGSNKT
ncbi:hypothetical protein [Robertkochia flava]|uniref:hypothetical protein n=1 Tax=Robertkochia flava TaxID=3447986 RepID=UPI001CCE0440|nr:hypothetical protein [Robertkochia marina]